MQTLADAPVVSPRSAGPSRLTAAPAPLGRDVSVPNGMPCTEEEYLHRYYAPNGAEYVDGRICYLPMPTSVHQRINKFVFRLLDRYLSANRPGADLEFNGQPVRVPDGRGGWRFRHPDVAALLDGASPLIHDSHWDGADFCAEVISPDDPPRDTVEKRREYAAAGIPEYWIVDPREEVRTVTVLTLVDGVYQGEPRGDGERAESVLLPGLSFDVTDCLDAR